MSTAQHSGSPVEGVPVRRGKPGPQAPGPALALRLEPWKRLTGLLRDRRGATAVLFGVTSVVVIGMVGLGTEGGSWYVTRRDAQNAADTAAYAGAVRLSLAQNALSQTLVAAQAQASATAIDTAARNGFTTGTTDTVTPTSPPATGPNSGNITAVQVVVQRTRPRLISSLFLTGSQLVAARGVAAIRSNGAACMLAIPGLGANTVTGQLRAGGNTTIRADDCVLASNSTRTDAVSVTGSASVTAETIVSSGGCIGCVPSGTTLDRPATTGAIPSTNPLAHLNTKVLPSSFSCYTTPVYSPTGGTSSVNISKTLTRSDSVVIPPPPAAVGAGAQPALCGLKMTGGTVTLTPGTYYIVDDDLTISGGTIECRMATSPPTAGGLPCSGGAGVTIVFTGNNPAKIGGPRFTGNPTVRLNAPTSARAADPDYAGVLFFRDPRATSPTVKITGSGTTVLTGAMYFPNSEVEYRGTPDATGCSILIGGTISMSGNSGVRVYGCEGLGYLNVVPNAQIVRLVE
jgi:Flp pilus assembly protein TadG